MKINSSVAANSYLLDAVTNNIDYGTSVRTFSLHSVRSIIMRLILVVMIVGGWNVVRGAEVTFTASNFSGQGTSGTGSAMSATSSGITVSTTKGYADTGHIREYKDGSITVSSAYTITKIVFTATSNGYAKLSNLSWSETTGTWTGSSTSVTFNATAQSRISQIVITYNVSGTRYTVSFNAGAGSCGTTSSTENSAGAGVTLPSAIAPAGCDPEYTFFGWSTLPVTETTTVPNTVVGTAGQTYHPTGNITLYAVYKQGEETYQLIENLSLVTEGTYYLLTTDYHAFNGNIDDGHGQIASSAFSFTGGYATAAPSGAIELILTVSGSGFTMYNSAYGYLYASAASSGHLAWHNTENSYWKYSNSNWTYNSNTAYLRSYSNSSFRTYSANNGNVLKMAKKEGVLTYNTNPSCTPPTTATIIYNPNGATSGTVPIDNNLYSLGDEVTVLGNTGSLAKIGHTFAGWNTAANGSGTTYSAGNTFIINANTTLYAKWTLNQYNVTWHVGGNTPEQTGPYNYGSTIPAGDVPTPTSGACDGKTFIGWSASEVDETDDEPSLTTAAGETVNGAMNFYAVFAEEGGGGDDWTQVTSLSNITNGEYVIVSDVFYLPNTETGSGSAPSATSLSPVTISGNKLMGTISSDMQWKFTVSGSLVTIRPNIANTSNYLYETANNNGIRVYTTSDTWTFHNYTSGSFYMQGTNNSRFCATYNSQDWRSYTSYNHTNYADGGKIYLFKHNNNVTYSAYSTSCVPCEADPAISSTALNFSDITSSSVTVEAPGGITSFGENCHIRSYGFVYGTSANPTLTSGTVAVAGTSYTTINSSFNKVIDGLSPCTTYHVRAYATNGHGTVYGSDCTFTTGSDAEITGLISVNGETSATLYWNLIGELCVSGHYVVICRQGSSDIASSCSNYDFTSIIANAAFGSGTLTSTGEYAVYSGSETSVAITNLTSGSTYTAAVFYVDDSGNCLLREQITFEYISITLLEPGDLAIVAVNNKRISTSGNTADEFSFMVFKNITAETSIDMTDNGYERNYAGYWGTEEGFWRITRKNRSLAAGSVVTISETVGRIGYNVEPALGTNINIYADGSLDNANWTIEVNGPLDLNREDQIWMMQGGEWNVIEDNKAEYTGNVLYGFTATGWKSNVGFDDTHGSRIYPSSGCFVTTIEVGEGIVKYTGPLDHATKGEWITRINNEDNWTDYTTSNYPNAARNYCNASRPDATNYPSVNYPLTIDPGDFTKGKWNGKESDDWCDCRNWVSLVVPDENFDVEIPDVGNRNRVSLHEGVTAKCKTLTVKSGGFFNNTQANSVLKVEDDITIDAGGSFRPSENNAFEIMVGGNILNSGVFITNENTSLTLNGESSQNISAPSSGGNFKLRNLTIASPSNVFDADTIELYGNLRDNSASNLGFNLPQALTFKGPSSQTSTSTAITDITMNKSSNNLTLSGMLTVDGKAKFVKGNIIGNVTFLASATSSNANTNSYVDGTVTKKANASAFTFPTGSNGVLGTLEVSSLDADTDLKFNHEPDGFDASEMPVWWNQNNMCGPNEGNAKFDHVTNMYFWNLGTSATIADAVFSVSADDDVHFNSETIEHDNADIDMAIYDGCWKNLGGTASTSDPYHLISVSDVDLPATRAGGDKVVTFGSIDHNTLLPIELTAFSAECNGSYAKILWTTATERNNDYFVLERSDDAISFDEIARLAGAGTSINQIDYTYIDNNVHGGDIFYRLVQVDYDGTRSISEIIAINCAIDADGEPEMAVYPNPFANDLTLHFENFGDRVALVEVYDMLGRMLVSRKVVCSQNDYEFVLPLGGLPDGAYNVRVSAEDVVINRQVVKNR